MIAILLSGRIQDNYENVISNISKLKDNYNIKIFCSLNKNADSDEFCQKFIDDFSIERECFSRENTIIPSNIYSYQKRPETSYENTYSMYYHNWKCLQMIENYQNKNNIKFDIVLKYRTDIYSSTIINIKKDKDDTIYIPEGYDWAGGLNDQIAYGSFDIMKKYCNCVHYIDTICQTSIYHPETILRKFIELKNLKLERFYFDYCLYKNKP